jgi:hypothetical protein
VRCEMAQHHPAVHGAPGFADDAEPFREVHCAVLIARAIQPAYWASKRSAVL